MYKKTCVYIVERHKIVRNRNTVFRTSHTLCRFTRSSNDRVTKQATRCSKCSDQQNSSRASNVSRSTAKTYSKTTTFISQVVFFYFQVFLFFYFFLILFFNSIVYRFFIARIFGVLPEYFRDWGAAAPPAPWLVRLCSWQQWKETVEAVHIKQFLNVVLF